MHKQLVPVLFAASSLLSCGGGSASDVYFHQGGTLTGANEWYVGTHTVEGTITISDGTLVIDAGAVLSMNSGVSVVVARTGGLQINGTPSNPAIITSAQAAPAPGDWGVFLFENGSDPNNVIANANFSYGGSPSGNVGDLDLAASNGGTIILDAGASLDFSNSSVAYSAGFGLQTLGDASLPNFMNNTLIHNDAGPASLTANVASQLGPGVYAPNPVAAIAIIASTLSQDGTWLNLGVPYSLDGLLTIQGSTEAILTVAAGTTLAMGEGAGIGVFGNGGLNLDGAEDSPVTVTSNATMSQPGDWYDISFYIGSITAANVISYANIELGGGDQKGEIWVGAGAGVSIQNSTLTQSATQGLQAVANSTLTGFDGNELSNNLDYGISLDINLVDGLQAGTNTYSPNANPGVYCTGDALNSNSTWGVIDSTGYVLEAQTLAVGLNDGTSNYITWNLLPGVTIFLQAQSTVQIILQGRINAQGSPGSAVVFTALDSSSAFGTIVMASPNNNFLNYVELTYGGAGTGVLQVTGGQVDITNLTTPIEAAGLCNGILVCAGTCTNAGAACVDTGGCTSSNCS